MTKVLKALKSRTFWTAVVLLLVNIIPDIKHAFPNAAWLDTVNGALVALIGYFHVNPSQDYTK